ncbi:MAG: nuclear transport factor 2 family protein [Anaerolineales bacterium]
MSIEKHLLSVFEELREALFECNQSKLIDLVSNEYQGFGLNGTIENKEIVLQTFKPGIIKLSKYQIEDMKCEVSGDFGIITGQGRIEGSYGEYEFQHHVLFTDIFKLINGRWQYYKSQATEIKSA